jgi:hypothetical protein
MRDSGISIFVITAASLGFNLPYTYYQYLSFPELAVLLPVAGMLALSPVVFRLAFGREEAPMASGGEAIGDAKPAVEADEDRYLKAA